MHFYVTDKVEIKELKSACDTIIKNIQHGWLRDYFTFQFNLIGSGMTNLITRNGQNGEYDLDYNFILQRDKMQLFSSPKKIKELFIDAFNDANPDLGFKLAENSTSVITSKLIYQNKLLFSFDVAIMCEGNNGNYLKISYNKSTKQYYWNEIKSSKKYQTKIKVLKECGAWNDVRDLYLKKKNDYLSSQLDKASFSVLLETLNEICTKYGVQV
jgi:hypothetical protein